MIDALKQPEWYRHLEDGDEIERCRREIEDFRRLARIESPSAEAGWRRCDHATQDLIGVGDAERHCDVD